MTPANASPPGDTVVAFPISSDNDCKAENFTTNGTHPIETGDIQLWLDRLDDWTTKRELKGHIIGRFQDERDRPLDHLLFVGDSNLNESTGATTGPRILDDPLSIQLDTAGRLYSLGVIEPDGRVYISAEIGTKSPRQVPVGCWKTACEQGRSGDLAHVNHTNDSTTLLVIDGLGHGEKAQEASLKAREVMYESDDLRPDRLMNKIHNGLKQTRGGVVFIARTRTDQTSVEYCSVGNISARLQGGDNRKFLSLNGTVGYQLPELKIWSHDTAEGYTIVCHTDGVAEPDPEFFDETFNRLSPTLNAARIHDRFKKGPDDALVLVCRL